MSRQIQANSRGDRDGTATASARRTSVAFAAKWKQNASQRSDLLTITRANTLGLQTMEQRFTSARIDSRLANLPIYVYDLRDSLKLLNLGSTDPIALSTVHSDTHLNSTACAEKQARPKAALTCIYN